MSLKQIMLLVALGLANLCVLGFGFALLLTSPAAQPAATPVAFEAAVMLTATAPLPTNTPSPAPPTLTPTHTRWASWTPQPTESPYPTWVFTSTATPTGTPTPTRISSATVLAATAVRPSTAVGPAPNPGGGGPAIPSNRIGCGTPNGQPTNGKLDVFWSYIAWEPIPNTDNVKGTIQVVPSGGNDCYKYNFMGNNYDYEPITFIVRKCGSTPVNLTVTSRDGQKWSQDFIIEVGTNMGFKCK